MKTKTFLTISLAFLFAISAFSQFTGPGSSKDSYTVKQIKEKAHKLDRTDKQITVTGKIIKQIKKDTYLFEDKSGSINVKIKEKNLPKKPFDANTEVTLTGEVDYDFLEGTEIEVELMVFTK